MLCLRIAFALLPAAALGLTPSGPAVADRAVPDELVSRATIEGGEEWYRFRFILPHQVKALYPNESAAVSFDVAKPLQDGLASWTDRLRIYTFFLPVTDSHGTNSATLRYSSFDGLHELADVDFTTMGDGALECVRDFCDNIVVDMTELRDAPTENKDTLGTSLFDDWIGRDDTVRLGFVIRSEPGIHWHIREPLLIDKWIGWDEPVDERESLFVRRHWSHALRSAKIRSVEQTP